MSANPLPKRRFDQLSPEEQDFAADLLIQENIKKRERVEWERDVIYALASVEIPEQEDSLDFGTVSRRNPENWDEWAKQNADLVNDADHVRHKMEQATYYADIMKTERAVNRRLNGK